MPARGRGTDGTRHDATARSLVRSRNATVRALPRPGWRARERSWHPTAKWSVPTTSMRCRTDGCDVGNASVRGTGCTANRAGITDCGVGGYAGTSENPRLAPATGVAHSDSVPSLTAQHLQPDVTDRSAHSGSLLTNARSRRSVDRTALDDEPVAGAGAHAHGPGVGTPPAGKVVERSWALVKPVQPGQAQPAVGFPELAVPGITPPPPLLEEGGLGHRGRRQECRHHIVRIAEDKGPKTPCPPGKVVLSWRRECPRYAIPATVSG